MRLSGGVQAVLIDPVVQRVTRIKLPEAEASSELMRLVMGAALVEGANENEFFTVSKQLRLSVVRELNPYTIWQDAAGRYVLMIGDKASHSHGFRLGKRKAGATTYWGPAVLLRYEEVVSMYGPSVEIRADGSRPYPAPKALKPSLPAVAWMQGAHDAFSTAAYGISTRMVGDIVYMTDHGPACCACCRAPFGETKKHYCECRTVYYCSKRCLKAHRPVHEPHCAISHV